jgi:hypothetical protein
MSEEKKTEQTKPIPFVSERERLEIAWKILSTMNTQSSVRAMFEMLNPKLQEAVPGYT